MISRQAAPISSRRSQIFGAVDDVAGHPHDMLRARAVLRENFQRVHQRLRELLVQAI